MNDYPYNTKEGIVSIIFLASRTISENGVETILALENENVNMECTTDMPMRYCGIVHPNGKRYSLTGPTTYNGKCSIKIKARTNDTGTWRCHMGSRSVGVETMKVIQLRVVGHIAAVESNITAVHGKSNTLYCTTTKGFIPLSYCRFEPPNALPFSIDSSVTESNPLLKRYYFPNNKSLDRGDCAVTIRKVKYDDFGTWTCGAGLEDGHEYTDFINFKVEGLYTVPNSSATGITFGVIAFIVFLCILGLSAWRYQWFLGSIRRREETIETHELGQMRTEATPSRTPSTPQPGRAIPSVVIESPSEPGTTTPLVSPEDSEVR
ncbi:unnamed protein product [Arctia plantaginis]|uniref:Immunoglobulin domain-containing protein n=1 Tax=Arctia plantaginis TaxID=874455 RepID=A0A8S1BIF0_ARCPL|nr:unnamed protein product [Arctia plantaginis]